MKSAENIKQELIDIRRTIHQNPEVGRSLPKTKSFVTEKLKEYGYEPEEICESGIVATIKGGSSDKTVLLRADMDALSVKEETTLDFKSNNGCMHACGHDMHTAMLLGAARLLKAHEAEICGTVRLMFQPAEEIFEGSADMIADGLLENPAVDGAMMIHVMAGMPFAAGTAIVSGPGVSAPGADYFEILVKGRGCHGSMPNTGVDPLTAAAHILIALQELSARELAMTDQAVLTVGTMHGGSAANAIPDEVVMGGSIRTFDEDVRGYLKQRLTEISEGIAATFRAQAAVTFGSGCPTLVNDPQLSRCAAQYAKELLGPERAFSAEELAAMSGGGQSSKSAGSEDFAYVSQQVPSIMVALAAGQPEKGYLHPQHHPMVRFDEDALPAGSAVYAYTALRWLAEHQ